MRRRSRGLWVGAWVGVAPAPPQAGTEASVGAPQSRPAVRYDCLMRWSSKLLLVPFAAALSLSTACAAAEKQTVCTITVNSADEKEAFRRHLPAAKYEFVELIERGRPDWLASACRTDVACDVLVISGHYDGGNEFFSDRLEAREFLPVAELERVSCNGSCPGLFSRLKEV